MVDPTSRGTAHTPDLREDAVLLQHGQRAGIGDALHAATLEDKIAKRIPGLRHEPSLAGDDSEFDAEAPRLAKLFQNAHHEKKPTYSWRFSGRYPVTLHFFNPLLTNLLRKAPAGGCLGLAGPMLKGG